MTLRATSDPISPQQAAALTSGIQDNYLVSSRNILWSAATGTGGINTSGIGSGSLATYPALYRTDTKQSVRFITDAGGGSELKFSIPYPNLTVAQLGKMGVWFFATETSGLTITLTLSSDLSVSKTRAFTWSNDQCKYGWNFLTIHTLEDGTTGPTTDGHGWVVTGGMTTAEIVNQIKLYVFINNAASCPIYLDSLSYGGMARPKVMLGFDDASSTSKVTYALPILSAYGYKAYQAADGNILGSFDGNANIVPSGTYASAVVPLYAAGWDIIQQGMNHVDYSANHSLLSGDFDKAKAIMIALGLTRALNFFAYPLGGSDEVTNTILKNKGVVKARSARRANLPVTEFGADQLVNHGSTNLGGMTLTQAKARIDSAILYGETVELFTHTLVVGGDGTTPPADPLTWYVNDYQSLVDYIHTKDLAGLIDVTTPSQFYPRLSTTYQDIPTLTINTAKPRFFYRTETAVNINSAATDVRHIRNMPSKYDINRVTILDPSTSLAASAATLGLYTAAAAGGTAVVTPAVMTTLTGATKRVDSTLASTDVFTSNDLYLRCGVAHGSAATVSVVIEYVDLT